MGLKENIKARRLEKGMTLEDVAKEINVSRQTIQRYESGVISNIPSDKIELIAQALDTTPSKLMGWEYDYIQPVPIISEKEKEIAHEIHENPEMLVLFETVKDMSSKRLQAYVDFMKKLKESDD